MSEKRESDEQERGEGEEGDSDTHPQPGGGAEEQPPEGDGEPGGGGEEEQEEQEDRASTAESSSSKSESSLNTALGGEDVLETAEEAEPRAELQDDIEQKPEDGGNPTEDVLETAEEAETQADLPDDAEPLTEPQRKENVGNSTATVKVVLVPEGHVMTVAFAIGLSIQELKRHLAAELRVPADVLQISVDGRVVEEQQSLMELGVRPHGSTRMEMSSTDPNAHPLRPVRPPEHDNMPDVITVRVQADEGVFQEVVVEIERPLQQKAFLGGYRHRLTGVEFHHAAVQTLRKRSPDKTLEVFSRDTQTVELKSQVQQCRVNASTQMTGIGCYVSCLNDKLVAPGNYVTADEHHDRRLRAVIRLQAFARRWLAQQEVDQVRRERDRRLAWLEMQERRRREEKEEQLRDRRQRWMNPQRREDFNLLYHALEKWRCDEEQRINSSLRGAERKAALCSLLEQEVQLIADIGRHQITVRHNNYDKTVRNFLDKSAAPHQWRAANGKLIEMDSLHIIRARELRDLYSSMNTLTVSREQRLQVLMTLKHTVKEHACQLTQDIVDLIDREVDLMTRGVKAASLEGLRKRISTLFLQYIKIPAFNPEVAKLLKVPQNPSQLQKDMFLCRSCQRYLRSADFTPSASNVLSSRCNDCTVLNNIAKSRNDYSCYKNILSRLRADELRLDKGAKIPFLLQVEDVQYLVEVVWASRSVLNGSSDLYNLVFVRWDRRRDWSPWNCLLLSNEETSAHMELEDISKAYEATFIQSIEHKHTLARRHFRQISVMAEYLDPRPAAAPGNQLVCKSITMATGERTADTTEASAC
ncbi:IQ motif and ubiquitin-like domain-containing protein isoform 1-T1 [Acanthopagrus schlegelii]